MFFITQIIFMMILAGTICGQINLAISAGSEYYENNEYNFSSKYTLQTFYSFKETGNIGLKIEFNKTSVDFLSPVGTKKINTTIFDYLLMYEYPLITNFYSLRIDPQIDVGLKNIQKNSYKISLGASGIRDINASAKAYFQMGTGVSIKYLLKSEIFIFLQSTVSFFDLNRIKRSYLMSGGIGVTFR